MMIKVIAKTASVDALAVKSPSPKIASNYSKSNHWPVAVKKIDNTCI